MSLRVEKASCLLLRSKIGRRMATCSTGDTLRGWNTDWDGLSAFHEGFEHLHTMNERGKHELKGCFGRQTTKVCRLVPFTLAF